MKVTNVIENVLIGTGIAVSLIDIQQWLSIILLVLDVCWILGKLGFKIYTSIKEKKYEETVDAIKTAHDELEDVQKTLENSEKKDEIPHGDK